MQFFKVLESLSLFLLDFFVFACEKDFEFGFFVIKDVVGLFEFFELGYFFSQFFLGFVEFLPDEDFP